MSDKHYDSTSNIEIMPVQLHTEYLETTNAAENGQHRWNQLVSLRWTVNIFLRAS